MTSGLHRMVSAGLSLRRGFAVRCRRLTKITVEQKQSQDATQSRDTVKAEQSSERVAGSVQPRGRARHNSDPLMLIAITTYDYNYNYHYYRTITITITIPVEINITTQGLMLINRITISPRHRRVPAISRDLDTDREFTLHSYPHRTDQHQLTWSLIMAKSPITCHGTSDLHALSSCSSSGSARRFPGQASGRRAGLSPGAQSQREHHHRPDNLTGTEGTGYGVSHTRSPSLVVNSPS